MWKTDGKTAIILLLFFKNRDKLKRELDLNLRKNLAKCYIWSTAEYGTETSESSTEISRKF
jgi:hypothetical protein